MKTQDYVKKFKLNINDKFNHTEFVADLANDFVALLELNKAQDNIKGFNNALNALRMKWDAINNKTVGNLQKNYGDISLQLLLLNYVKNFVQKTWKRKDNLLKKNVRLGKKKRTRKMGRRTI